jgi:hypothetical protein
MLTQQLTGNSNDMSGKLVITAAAGQLPELQSLAEELKLRANIETHGTIEIVVEHPPPSDV